MTSTRNKGSLIVWLLLALSGISAAAAPLPRLERNSDGFRLIVDEQPFLILGAQIHNSSAGNSDDLRRALDRVAGMHANVAEVPIYWESIEPEPGRYDFSSVDLLLREARCRNLRVVLLWFGTYKNGESHYAPDWMKRDRRRFERVIGSHGEESEIVSPLSAAALEADRRAFVAVLHHLRTVDEADRTVIMVQVENEPGLLDTDRDYSSAATSLFEGDVPARLTDWLVAHRATLSRGLSAAWGQSGYRATGTWREVFGDMAPEAFSAWTMAHYVEAVAAAGKREYPLPFYVNAWLCEGWERAGRWPSGGATEHVLDLWKEAAPSIDILAPDLYYQRFYDTAASYVRPDNALLVSEASFEPYFAGFVYTVLGDFNGIGFSPFGVDDVARNGAKDERYAANLAAFEDDYRALRPLLSLIARYQHRGRIHTVLHGVGRGEDWAPTITLGQHVAAVFAASLPFSMENGRAEGMVIELDDDSLLLVGKGFKVTFRELEGPIGDAQLLSIEEGGFEGEQWRAVRRYNGDERAVVFPEKTAVIRVRLNRP